MSETPNQRRKRGTGTVEKSGSMWRFRCPDGQGGKFTSKAEYETEKLAENALAIYRKKIASRELVPIRGITLSEYFDDTFIVRTEQLHRPGTVQMYKSRWAQIRKAPFAKLPLSVITRSQVKLWAKSLRVSRPDNYLAALHAVLNQAVDDELITVNPASNITLEVKRPDEDSRRPTPEEQEALLSCKQIPWQERLIMMVAMGSGLRPGEWRNLELPDVHVEDTVPHVGVQYGSDNHGPTKTGKKRRVPLIGMALRAMQLWLKTLPEYCPDNPLNLVFPHPSGHRRSADSPFGRIGPRDGRVSLWHTYLKAAGITRKLTPHCLRHACATDLLTGVRGQRLEAWQVQVLLGHGRITTTLKYLHAGERDLFSALANQSWIGPEPIQGGVKTAAILDEMFTGKIGAEERGFEPPPCAQGPPIAGPQTVFTSARTDPGLISRARSELARMRAQSFPSLESAQSFAIDALREHEDPAVRAAARVLAGGPTYLVAFLDLLEAVGADQEPAVERKGGSR